MNGIKATIVMPSTAPLAKVTATKGYGAEVVLAGSSYMTMRMQKLLKYKKKQEQHFFIHLMMSML